MDKRVSKTVDAIQKAFLNLLKYDTFKQITIKKICQQADIERRTFYLHFKNKDDLLKSLIYRYMVILIDRFQLENANTNLPRQKKVISFYIFLLSFHDNYRNIIKNIYTGRGSVIICEAIQNILVHHLKKNYKQIDSVAVSFCSAGIANILESYLRQEIVDSKESIASRIVQILKKVT